MASCCNCILPQGCGIMNLLQRHIRKFNSPNQAEFTYIFVLFFTMLTILVELTIRIVFLNK